MALPYKVLDPRPDIEILHSRTFHKNADLVFKAFSEPGHLKNWWGPKGFSNTFHEFDFNPGGKWRFTMHGPEKGNYENECVFLEIIPGKRIIWNRISQPLFQMQIELDSPMPGETRLVFRMVFMTPEECSKLRNHVPEKNEENLDKLETELDLIS